MVGEGGGKVGECVGIVETWGKDKDLDLSEQFEKLRLAWAVAWLARAVALLARAVALLARAVALAARTMWTMTMLRCVLG